MDNLDFESASAEKIEDIPVGEIDAALKTVRELELDYNEKKKISSEAYSKYEEAKMAFITLLKKAGKTKWECEGATGFSLIESLKWRVPQGPDAKEEFFKFIQSDKVTGLMEQDARDIFLHYASVHAQSLNSLCKKINELANENGEQIEIPGLMPPTTEVTLRSLPKKRSK